MYCFLEAKQRENELAIKFARQLKKFGVPINEISEETGLGIEELRKVL